VTHQHPLIVRHLGLTAYAPVFAQMQHFTDVRTPHTVDELWLTQHQPVFTQGQAGKAEHVLAPGAIPIVQSDRGGQVTYHGPGQITAYLLFDLRRLGLGVRDLVTGIENAMVATLAAYDIVGEPRADAPGVYVRGDKIGSLGLRVRRGCSYHGLSLNVDMDLEPFARINPCGLFGMQVTDMAGCQTSSDSPLAFQGVEHTLVEALLNTFNLVLHTPDTMGVDAV